MMEATKHTIIGTAGHVDHGKSALIHALTGIETDRLKEEKERGLSIELGSTSSRCQRRHARTNHRAFGNHRLVRNFEWYISNYKD